MARTKKTARKTARKTDVQKRKTAFKKKEKSTATTAKPTEPAELAQPAEDSKHIVRRILAQDGDKYLMDWLPSYEKKNILDDPDNTQALIDWNSFKKDKKAKLTFTFDGCTVLRCSNPTEDNHNVTARTMTDNIFRHFRNFMRGNADSMAGLLFPDSDWSFTSELDANAAINIFTTTPDSDRLPPPQTAGEVMRRTYIQMRTLRQTIFAATDITYASINVTYIGEIDPKLKRLRPDKKARIPATTLEHLAPLFAHKYKDIKPRKWDTPALLHEALQPLHTLATSYISTAPYILARPPVLLFVRMFFTSEELVPLLRSSTGIRVTSYWPDHSRDKMLYGYMRESGDSRAVDCVERTYLGARDGVMWAVKYKGEEDDEEVTREEGVYVVLSEDEDEDE